MKVLVTGATGFLGSHIVEALQEAGHEVRALARASSRLDHVGEREVEVVTGDLRDPDSLARAVEACGAVIHAAGLIRAKRRADLYRVNASASGTLAAACRDAGVRRLVYISSLAAGGPAAGPNEAGPGTPLSHYGRSKRQGEEAVLAVEGLEACALRPPILYGPRDREMLALFRMAARGRVPVPRMRNHGVSLLSGADAARAAVKCLEGRPGRVYDAGDDELNTWEGLAESLGAAVGRPVATWRVPLPVLAVAAALATSAAWITRRAPAMPWDGYRDLRQAYWVTRSEPLRTDTGWSPSLSLKAGLAATSEWYRAAGWLDR